jgi:flagellar basal body-associated protein FliL
MRSLIPFILIGLALFAAGCIAYIAWELSSDADQKPDQNDQ